MPVAPFCSACSMSSGSSMLACSSTWMPSSVSARLLRRRLQLLPRELELVLLQPVLGEHGAIGIDDDDVVAAVDDQHLAVADQLARVVRRDDRRDVEAARDDRRVRRDAAEIGEERARNDDA